MKRQGAYHPSHLFAEKRRQRAAEREKARSELPKIDLATGEAQSTNEKAEQELKGDELLLSKAEKFVIRAQSLLEDLYAKYKTLMALNQSSLKVEADDDGRKGHHREFLAGIQDLNAMATNLEIDGIKLFSGQFSKEGYRMPLTEKGNESVVLRVGALTAQGLKLDRIKIDTLINARKAVADIEKGKDVFEETVKQLNAKFDTIVFKKTKLENEKIDDGGSKKLDGKSSQVAIMQRLKQEFLKEIRATQERLAEEKGEDKALLVKTIA